MKEDLSDRTSLLIPVEANRQQQYRPDAEAVQVGLLVYYIFFCVTTLCRYNLLKLLVIIIVMWS